MPNEPKSTFIPNIDTANEEIDRLNARVKELEAKPTATEPTKPAQAALTGNLTGVARAIAANQKAQRK
jgi:hypothetical protein